MKILYAEDEQKLADNTSNMLQNAGYAVSLAYDGKAAQKMLSSEKFDLLILDINLPFVSGFEVCKMVRQKDKDIPIIMLTALGEIDDKMTAFDIGADDYLVKPFHSRELLARINVFSRRTENIAAENECITVSDLTIDLANKSITRAEKNINLTAREYGLLLLLAQANGTIVSKPVIAEKVWGIDFDTGTNTIEVYISFLRNKIDKPFETKLIHTKPGFGYYLKEES